jgi:predicted ATP-grasp superfamily ATP-dependent carboligase
MVPGALESPQLFGDALLGIVADHDIGFLVPMTEAALRVALPLRNRLGNVLLPFPDIETFERASDKAALTEQARANGILVPQQTVLASRRLTETELNSLRFPLVLKPAASVYRDGDRQRKTRVIHVASRNEFDAVLEGVPDEVFPILAQRRVEGPGIGIFLLRWDGATRAAFAHRRIREKPPSGGVSVYRESIQPANDWIEQAETLLAALDWKGVAMVEFKQDAAEGSLVLMEINGRFWGSLQLAIDAGVDFPKLLLDCALGRPPASPPEWKSGIRLRWELGDMDHLLARARSSDTALHLPPDAPSRLSTVGSVLWPWRRGERWEVLRPSDPKPFFREFSLWIKGQ